MYSKERIKLEKLIARDVKLLSNLQSKLTTLDKAKEFISEMLIYKKQECKMLEDIVNEGLKFTYPEKELEFKMIFVEKNNRVIPEFYLNELKLIKPFIGEGGGIVSTIGMLIYLTSVKLNGTQLILIDESTSMIDIEAFHKLVEFIRYFSSENNIKIMMISHNTIEEELFDNEQLTNKIKVYS